MRLVRSDRPASLVGTFETCRRALRISVDQARVDRKSSADSQNVAFGTRKRTFRAQTATLRKSIRLTPLPAAIPRLPPILRLRPAQSRGQLELLFLRG